MYYVLGNIRLLIHGYVFIIYNLMKTCPVHISPLYQKTKSNYILQNQFKLMDKMYLIVTKKHFFLNAKYNFFCFWGGK